MKKIIWVVVKESIGELPEVSVHATLDLAKAAIEGTDADITHHTIETEELESP